MKKEFSITSAERVCDNIFQSVKQKIFVDQYYDLIAYLKVKSITNSNQLDFENILTACIKLETYIIDILNTKSYNSKELKENVLSVIVSLMRELISRELLATETATVATATPAQPKNTFLDKTEKTDIQNKSNVFSNLADIKSLEKEILEEKEKLSRETEALLKKTVMIAEA